MKLIFVSHLAKNMLLFRSEFLKSLASNGHQVFVVCPKDKDCSKFDDLGVEYIEWSFDRKGGLFNALTALRQLVSLFINIKPDRTVSYMIQPILLCSVARLFVKFDLTCVFTGLGTLFIQRSSFKYKTQFIIIKNLLKILLKISKRVVVLNRDDYKEMSCICSNEKLFLLPGEGIDLRRFKYENLNKVKIDKYKTHMKANSEKVILYLGRFIKEKGIHHFVEIAEEFSNIDKYHFVAVGECDFGNPSSLNENELLKLKKTVTVINWSDAIPEILYNTDLMLYPSKREGYPVGVMEALASKVQVVGYDVPGVRDILANQTVYGDVGQLKREMLEKLKSEKDDINISSFSVFKRIIELKNILGIN
jgi:glycosyltransferase involved in cell wall biosynthesis